MEPQIEFKIDKNGLREVFYNGASGKKSLCNRGPLDEEHKDMVVDVLSVGTVINMLRKANLWVVVTTEYTPGE